MVISTAIKLATRIFIAFLPKQSCSLWDGLDMVVFRFSETATIQKLSHGLHNADDKLVFANLIHGHSSPHMVAQ